MAEFLKQLREKGGCEMFFPMDADFREKFALKEKRMVFNTHEDLDKFVADLVAKEPDFETVHKAEWAMLKSFDRSFWLRHYKFDKDPKWEPMRVKTKDEDGDTITELKCPFVSNTLQVVEYISNNLFIFFIQIG